MSSNPLLRITLSLFLSLGITWGLCETDLHFRQESNTQIYLKQIESHFSQIKKIYGYALDKKITDPVTWTVDSLGDSQLIKVKKIDATALSAKLKSEQTNALFGVNPGNGNFEWSALLPQSDSALLISMPYQSVYLLGTTDSSTALLIAGILGLVLWIYFYTIFSKKTTIEKRVEIPIEVKVYEKNPNEKNEAPKPTLNPLLANTPIASQVTENMPSPDNIDNPVDVPFEPLVSDDEENIPALSELDPEQGLSKEISTINESAQSPEPGMSLEQSDADSLKQTLNQLAAILSRTEKVTEGLVEQAGRLPPEASGFYGLTSDLHSLIQKLANLASK